MYEDLTTMNALRYVETAVVTVMESGTLPVVTGVFNVRAMSQTSALYRLILAISIWFILQVCICYVCSINYDTTLTCVRTWCRLGHTCLPVT